jgi:hypothetical protein
MDSGQRAEFTPHAVQPLGLKDLYATEGGENPALRLSWHAKDFVIDDKPIASSGVFHSTVQLQNAPQPFALVPGGWLPLPLTIPLRFLVDSNVVANLRKLKSLSSRPDLAGFKLWMDLFAQGGALFNPLPYAWEGQKRRAPTFGEFVQGFEAGVSEMQTVMPGANVVRFGPAEFKVAFAIRIQLESEAPREAAFLQAICPSLVDRVKEGQEAPIEKAIFDACEQYGVPRHSFATLAALSCLNEDPHGKAYSIGKRLLKPSRRYSASEAYNALNDLSHMRLAIISGALHGDTGFSLATSDRALTAFWCALRPVGRRDERGDIDIESDLGPELFPRLSLDGIKRLELLLRE